MLEPICSDSSLAAGEPLIGSAPDAIAWVCLEQNGPWGAKALTSSHLDPVVGAAFQKAAELAGVRPSLIRRPGRHADTEETFSRPTVLIGHTHPGSSWLLAGRLDSPAQVLELDFAAIAAGSKEVGLRLEVDPRPHLLICTNGTRDTCCARLGRPVAASAAAAHPGRVWEVTHTSGHRFAPTSVLLPSGHLHGRILDGARVLAEADAGQLALTGWRGRSTWPAPAQAAEDVVRREVGVTGIDDLTVHPDGDNWRVTHADGRAWSVTVTSRTSGQRSESCGKEMKPVTSWVARIL